jgi:Fe-S oxidoreductase/nitrate reductase gamma subunit
MLPLGHRIAFLIFAVVTSAVGLRGFFRVYRRIRAGREDSDKRFDHLPQRIWYALVTSLTQSRTFRKRPTISFFHSFIFYGFAFYILVNLIDGVEGFVPFTVSSTSAAGIAYNLLADILSALILIGVIALVIRRFALPSRRDFSFNERTLLHPDVKSRYIRTDSLIVSAFIVFHVGSRAVGAGAKLVAEGPDPFQPFATLFSRAFTPTNAEAWRLFGYWGALGSVLAFLAYFPRSKHIHIFMAPAKYLVARTSASGVLPSVDLNLESEDLKVGANKLEDLAWPRLLDAYACIQCNRCQDACPATATGKSLSPSALEINKRMELNSLARHQPGFERGEASPHPLLAFALSAEAAWACTTCGACMEVCPVQDEPMLDIIDIRRNQVMIHGEFPAQLQSAFRGMERAKNPWGINHEKRMDWAEGLPVKTIDENPDPDVLYWVGCAASYDPQAQKTARAFVQLLGHAGVNFSVLGKKECCTGDSARRSGNELLYRQLAEQNVSTLTEAKPKLIVATCPHCMNAVGNEYRQLGGDFKVMHHTEYLETLVAQGHLQPEAAPGTVAFHDPCYLGRHNGVYDAPRNLLRVLSNEMVELGRNRESSFCCGAGGAQFWKEEEPGTERISDNRYREAQQALAGSGDKALAVGCPFCKSMLESTPGRNAGDPLPVKDVAELLLEGVIKKLGAAAAVVESRAEPQVASISLPPDENAADRKLIETKIEEARIEIAPSQESSQSVPGGERKKWSPKKIVAEAPTAVNEIAPAPEAAPSPVEGASPAPATDRKKWTPGKSAPEAKEEGSEPAVAEEPKPAANYTAATASPERKKWSPKKTVEETTPIESRTEQLPTMTPTVKMEETNPTQFDAAATETAPSAPLHGPSPSGLAETQASDQPKRKVWKPKTSAAKPETPDPSDENTPQS